MFLYAKLTDGSIIAGYGDKKNGGVLMKDPVSLEKDVQTGQIMMESWLRFCEENEVFIYNENTFFVGTGNEVLRDVYDEFIMERDKRKSLDSSDMETRIAMMEAITSTKH